MRHGTKIFVIAIAATVLFAFLACDKEDDYSISGRSNGAYGYNGYSTNGGYNGGYNGYTDYNGGYTDYTDYSVYTDTDDTCYSCHGTGYSSSTCTWCDGDGIDPAYEHTEGSALHSFAEKDCASCGGVGRKRCGVCYGSGRY